METILRNDELDLIKYLRPIANSFNFDRLIPYRDETEIEWIMQAIGVRLYKEIITYRKTQPATDIENVNLVDEQFNKFCDISGKYILISRAPDNIVLDELLSGGYYEDKCGNLQYFEGLFRCIAYLTYSRFIRNQQYTVSQMGVDRKKNDLSDNAEQREVARLATETQNIGLKYLDDCIRYLIAKDLITDNSCSNRYKRPAFGALKVDIIGK